MNVPVVRQTALLRKLQVIDRQASTDVRRFICDPDSIVLSRKYEANLQNRNLDIGFNLFELISDHYHRETLHTDILHSLLNPDGKHCDRTIYLRLFLRFIRSRGAEVEISNYQDAHVEKEQGRIDIAIVSNKSRRAIIIENKINDAGDMLRQLPRYLAELTARRYRCDAIIYLRLNGEAGPDSTGWTNEERKEVMSLLTVICAYAQAEPDLLVGWIRKCERASTNLDARFILRQYGALIAKLGGNVMNKPIMEKFYAMIIKEENLKTALSLKAMIDDLILYRVERIIDRFKHDLAPFHKIANWHDNVAYLTDCFWHRAHFGIDVIVEPEKYVFKFWDRNDDWGKAGRAKAILQQMGCLADYSRDGGCLNREFAFPAQERQLIQHISLFKRNLSRIVTPLSSAAK